MMIMVMTTDEIEEGGVVRTWTTWEELLLGAAVLRHGPRDWDRVSSEVRCRIGVDDCRVGFAGFTAEACKAKYEELRERFSGCTAWFEELRMQRMLELRQAIQQSESSIGSLEYKLESLKAEPQECYSDDSSRTVSEEAVPKLHRSDSLRKGVLVDAASSDSLTRDVSTNCSADGPAETSRSPEEQIMQQPDIPQCPNTMRHRMLGILEEFCFGGYIRKRRGKRKRKGSTLEVKEGSVGENMFVGSADVRTDSQSRETLTLDIASARDKITTEETNIASKDYSAELMRLCDMIMEHKCAGVFLRRLNCQKRGRYKKAIRQHMDFQTIKSRITSSAIASSRELFRDMLLLINNALVFYSKNTREYKSATLLRDVVSSTRRQTPEETSRAQVSVAPIADPPPAPTMDISAAPAEDTNKLPGKVKATKNGPPRTPRGSKKSTKSDATPSVEESRSGGKRQANTVENMNERRRPPPLRPRKAGKRQRTR
ncbi:hypothetical protein MLD38_021127 [Melastoma candidum]|uniref:Uncharacterized protein n=1 Tax=Melastoma candidum TaxID=119954 RepID=A0ACB9QGC7_9MYRT|nr:hypothetical protein MLD38_021127 [Melastoma candidum]